MALLHVSSVVECMTVATVDEWARACSKIRFEHHLGDERDIDRASPPASRFMAAAGGSQHDARVVTT